MRKLRRLRRSVGEVGDRELLSAGTSSEQGAITIITVMLLTLLIAFVGMAINSAIFTTSKQQQYFTAEQAALAALQSYSNTSGTPVEKLLAARDRAEQTASINIYLGRGFQENPSLPEELGVGVSQASQSEGPSGKIMPGVWHFVPPIDAETGACQGKTNSCPCPGGLWEKACFEELDLNDPTDAAREVNAMQVKLKLRSESPMRLLFSSIVNEHYAYFQSEATAAVNPTHGVFLIDLSRGSHNETHQPYERVGVTSVGTVTPSEYAYQIANPVLNSCPADFSNPCVPAGSARIAQCQNATARNNSKPTICEFSRGKIYSVDPLLYTALYNYCDSWPSIFVDNVPIALRNMLYSTRHAKADYACYTTQYSYTSGVGQGNVFTENYLVDSYRGVSRDRNPYEGPEPLTTMLSGVNYATRQIAQRKVPGDQLGAIGFDERADINIRTFPLAGPGQDSFTELQEVSDISVGDPSAGNRLIKRNRDHMFFSRPDARADLPGALEAALKMLIAAPNAASANNFVFLLSDGLSGCVSNGGGEGTEDCGQTENYNERSINQSLAYIRNEYVKHKVKFHFGQIGDIVGPHTVLRRGATAESRDGCMGMEEAMEGNVSLVDPVGSHVPSMSLGEAASKWDAQGRQIPTAYYYYPARLFEGVVATQGIFAPLRPACSASAASLSQSQCSNGDLLSFFNSKCAEQSAGAIVPGIREFSFNRDSSAAMSTNAVDADGRLYCDPLCRDRRQQLQQYLDQVLNESPYIIVK